MKTIYKYFLFFVLISFSFKGVAQAGKYVWNIPKFDRKAVHFGFQVGLTQNNLDVRYTDKLHQTNIKNVELITTSGFNVGMLADLRLNKHFNLRFVPTLTLVNRQINYTLYQDATKSSTLNVLKNDEAALLNVPISLKFRAARRGNLRPYVLAGGQLIYDMSSDKNVNDKEVLNLNTTDFGLHFGLGIDFYLEFFKFGIETKYVYGLTDLKIDNGTQYYDVFESIHHRGLQVILTFE